MYSRMLVVALSIMLSSGEHAWTLLYILTAVAIAMLVLILVDKPYRDGDQIDDMTQADWQAVLAQVLLLISYGVAALCLQDNAVMVDTRAAQLEAAWPDQLRNSTCTAYKCRVMDTEILCYPDDAARSIPAAGYHDWDARTAEFVAENPEIVDRIFPVELMESDGGRCREDNPGSDCHYTNNLYLRNSYFREWDAASSSWVDNPNEVMGRCSQDRGYGNRGPECHGCVSSDPNDIDATGCILQRDEFAFAAWDAPGEGVFQPQCTVNCDSQRRGTALPQPFSCTEAGPPATFLAVQRQTPAELSNGMELFAAIIGVGIVLVQISSLVYAARSDATEEATEEEEEEEETAAPAAAGGQEEPADEGQEGRDETAAGGQGEAQQPHSTDASVTVNPVSEQGTKPPSDVATVV
eukprot:COSAG02_NODE_997_length_15333_cov_13.688526_12_plen_409_part_00